jgi:predicted transposase YdaD
MFNNLTGGYDAVLKWLTEQEPQGFCEWLMSVLGQEGIVLTDTHVLKELAPAPRHADLVWRITSPNGEEALLHIELQLEPESNMAQRMEEYAARLLEREHLPVIGVVIMLRRTSTIPAPPYVVSWNGIDLLSYRFFVVKLWEMPQNVLLEKPFPLLWPLAALMAKADGTSVANVGQQIANQKLGERLKELLIGYLGLLAGIQLDKDVVLEALRRYPIVDKLWQSSSVGKALVEEAEARGRAEGRVEGAAQAARRMARLALEGRFGALDQEALTALDKAEEATLAALVAEMVAHPDIPLAEVKARFLTSS